MNPRTLLALIAVLAALAATAWFQLRREQTTPVDAERPLVAGFDAARLARMRVEHLVRDLPLTLELDGRGQWQITDPVQHPADAVIVAFLIDTLSRNTGKPVPDADAAQLGLSPPRCVIELEEVVDGARTSHRVEIGAIDVDPAFVFVRIDGTLMRTLANLDTAVDRQLFGWRSKVILPGLVPRNVVEIHRSSDSAADAAGPVLDLELDAAVTNAGWQATRPFRGLLDPTRIGNVLAAAASLEAVDFVDAALGKPEMVGLDRPLFRWTFVDEAGVTRSLRFARDQRPEIWLCMREDSPVIWKVDQTPVGQLMASADTWVDPKLERFAKNEIGGIRLLAGGRELRVERAELGSAPGRSPSAWTVRDSASAPVPADGDAVEDLLGQIGRAGFVQRVRDANFPADARDTGIFVIVGGVEYGGWIGPEHASAQGGQGLLFQREGEDLVFLVEPSLVDLARTSVADLESRQVVKLTELLLRRARLTRGDQTLAFERNDRGRWSPAGVDQEARDFAILIDHLISVRGERWLPEDGSAPLEGAIEVELTDADGKPTSYRVGRVGEDVVCEFAGRRAVVSAELEQALARLFTR